jgi:Transposase IS4
MNHILTTLFVCFPCRYQVLLVGTCRNNCKGWPKTIMSLQKLMPHGTYKMAYCHQLNIAVMQWCDSKVVNCVTSYLDFQVTMIQQQIGSVKKSFSCPSALVHYQRHMGGVDKGDQIRGHFGGFAAQSHFKKWYKKTLIM